MACPISSPRSVSVRRDPSLHVGRVLLPAATSVAAGRMRQLALAHPALTTVVVVGTGNRYWLDVLVAVGLLVLAALPRPALVPAAATARVGIGPVSGKPVMTS